MTLRSGKNYHLTEPEKEYAVEKLLLSTSPPTYSVDIDFDTASKEWRQNKVKYGQGCFRYLRRSTRLGTSS